MNSWPEGGVEVTCKARWLPALLLALLTFTAYLPAARGGFIWDDELYAGNPLLSEPNGLARILTLQPAHEQYYRDFPVVYVSFWLERRLWGMRPMGYHLVNIALHLLNAILVWLILKRLRLRGAWMAAAIFALHPVQVESVAWISERKNVLSGFFYLLALDGYLRFDAGRGRRWYLAALMMFPLALLSKAVTCTLPVVLLLLRWQRGLEIRRDDLKHLLPFFLLALGMGLFTLRIEGRQLGPEYDLSLAQHALLAGRELWFYAMKLAWPTNLAFSYERWTLDARSVSQWLWIVGAMAAGAWIWHQRRRLGRDCLAGLGFYVITISPMLGFTSDYTFRYSFVADHYQYLASLGLIAVGVGCAQALLRGRTAKIVCGAVILVALGFGTWRQGFAYRDLESIWKDTIEKNPSSWLAHNNLGFALAGQGRIDEAIEQYYQSLRWKSDYAEAHLNLGVVLYGRGKVEESISHYREALKSDPSLAVAYRDLGIALVSQGRLEEGIACYLTALKIKPGDAAAHNNLGWALQRQGQVAQAIAHYQEALRLDPGSDMARGNLAAALRSGGQDSAEVHYITGMELSRQGREEEAISQYREALRLRPDFAEAHNNWGVALAGSGRLDEAVAQYREALRIKPDLAEARQDLGLALVREGRLDEAIVQFREAVKIKPDFADARYSLGLTLADQERRPRAKPPQR
jgi:tetratricopeptide (TPR) repeat protein